MRQEELSPRQPVSRVLYPRLRTTVIYLGLPLPTASCGQPGDGPDTRSSPYSALRRMGLAWTPAVASGAVSSYLTFSPLLALGERSVSVALSVGSPRPAVSGHPVRRSSDFPLSRPGPEQRPPSRLGYLSVQISLTPCQSFCDAKVPSPSMGSQG